MDMIEYIDQELCLWWTSWLAEKSIYIYKNKLSSDVGGATERRNEREGGVEGWLGSAW